MKLTAEQKAKNAVKWLRALKNPNSKKTVGMLGDGLGSYCCLGIGCLVTKIQPDDWSDPEEDRLPGLLGINSETGYFKKSIDTGVDNGDGTTYRSYCLVDLNDEAFPDDKNFKNIHKVIVNNLGKVFNPRVAREIRNLLKK